MFRSLRSLAATAGVAAVLAGGGIAGAHALAGGPGATLAAANPSPSPSPGSGKPAACRPARLGAAAAALAIVAKDTGLTRDQVLEQLRAGRSLGDIAGAKASTVEQDLLAALKSRLDKAVAAGRLDASREQEMLAKATSRLQTIMGENLSGRIPPAGSPASCGQSPRALLVRETARETGQTVDQVLAELKSGKTIDDIAGSKAASIKAAVAQQLEKDLSTRLDHLMSTPFGTDRH